MMPAVSAELQREVEVFLYIEARLLEENRFDAWLECFTADARYSLPVREHVEGGDATAGASGFALYDDDKQSLQLRVTRIKTGVAHAEVPYSVTQRLITNVMVFAGDKEEECMVSSNFMVYQERRGKHGVTFFGHR